MVLSAVAFVYQIVIPRWLSPSNDWQTPLRRAAMIAAAFGIATLLAVMGLEANVFLSSSDRIVPINDAQLVAVSIVLVGLIVALLASALSTARDPFSLSERGRMVYVYGAQAAAALLFAHLYLCRPIWFSGWIGTYWPYVILVIAFGGVGASELFRQRGQSVLAEPMLRTAFSPVASGDRHVDDRLGKRLFDVIVSSRCSISRSKLYQNRSGPQRKSGMNTVPC